MSTIYLSGPLDFDTVPDVYRSNRKNFMASPSIKIDFSAVTQCNSAALALIFEWIHDARTFGKTLTFLHIPKHLESIAEVSGVRDAL